MSISSRAVALIVPRPLDPEKAARYKHMRFGDVFSPSLRTVYGIARDANVWLSPAPRGLDRWLDQHMWAFWTIIAGSASYAAWTVFGLLVGG